MELLTETRSDLPTHLFAFAAMHDAMVRDAARLRRAVPQARTLGSRRSLARWWGRFERTIVHHHEREDDVVWPELVARDPGFERDRPALVEDHATLDRAMDRVRRALADPSLTDADSAVERFEQVLVDHLRREERAAFPRLATIPAGDYRAIERRLAEGGTLRDAAFELPWVLEDARPEFVEAVHDIVPAPMWALDRLWWRRSYRRTAAAVLGA